MAAGRCGRMPLALAAGDGMVVVGPIGGDRVLSEVDVSSSVMTPNGDGVNDETTFEFAVINLTGPQEVGGADLRPVRPHGESDFRGETRGKRRVQGVLGWPGSLAAASVAPGIYLAAIEVDTDEVESVEECSGAPVGPRGVLNLFRPQRKPCLRSGMILTGSGSSGQSWR